MARDLPGPAPRLFFGDGFRAVHPNLGGAFPPGVEMVNPVEFLTQVRAEANKVTWPTRRETLITTGLVIVMVVLASLFFLAVDQTLRVLVRLLLDFAR